MSKGINLKRLQGILRIGPLVLEIAYDDAVDVGPDKGKEKPLDDILGDADKDKP
ncbi:MAG: hypothetical protein ABIH46_13015 [Chloroflexota bacterium]